MSKKQLMISYGNGNSQNKHHPIWYCVIHINTGVTMFQIIVIIKKPLLLGVVTLLFSSLKIPMEEWPNNNERSSDPIYHHRVEWKLILVWSLNMASSLTARRGVNPKTELVSGLGKLIESNIQSKSRYYVSISKKTLFLFSYSQCRNQFDNNTPFLN